MPEPSFLDLFFIFLKTGAFTFGGGYAMIPLLQAQIVPTYLEGPEMSNLIALAQMTPGAVGLNTATYVGYSEYSFIGAVCCTLALILPCFTVATIVSFFKKAFQDNKYVKNALFGIRAMVVGMILTAVLSFADGSVLTSSVKNLWKKGAALPSFCWQGVVIFVVIAIIELKWKLNTILSITIAGLLGLAL
ncbi:MAG: chromate transporter, partial [Victivallales bacterium]|nr:chromate transporter [Victivallales bacterium]